MAVLPRFFRATTSHHDRAGLAPTLTSFIVSSETLLTQSKNGCQTRFTSASSMPWHTIESSSALGGRILLIRPSAD